MSSSTGANLLASTPSTYFAKCVDVYPQSDKDILLAIGYTNGRIILTTFGPTIYDSQGIPKKELFPRYPRQCNAVAWNPIDVNKIIGGLDKHRSEHSVLLWDVVRGSSNYESSNNRNADHPRPISEYGLSETTYSLAWFQNNSKLVAAGMSLKNIKLIDFRDTTKAATSTLTKAVYGVCVDPHNDHYLASFHDSQIYVWDVRNFEKSMVCLTQPKSLMKISWCPTKHNLLGALHKESSLIHLYDIQQSAVANEDFEPSVLDRTVVPGSSKNLTSFSWHETDENRLLTIASNGSLIDYTVFESITLNYAANFNMVWTYGRKTMKCINKSNELFANLDDVSYRMMERAKNGYGLKDELYKNGELVDDDAALANVWNWLYYSEKLVADGTVKNTNSKHPGVRDVLKLDANATKSEAHSTTWLDLPATNNLGVIKQYNHEDRDCALNLCGWHMDTEKFLKFLDRLAEKNAHSRAAALAVFNLRLRTAIDILHKSPDRNLNVVAMALAGFTDDKNSMWRQFCSNPKVKMSDPYLRAMFAFLTAENANYDNVLNENEISVDDRVAFACTFLSDSKLNEYLKSLTTKMISEGNLDGMLLTGNNMDGIRLLQRYLDITGDVQSTALVSVRAFGADLLQETQDWVLSYTNLLDTWQLWHERALFDVMFQAQRPNDKPRQQVFVSCKFCGKSISAYMHGLNRGRGTFSRMGVTANKMKMSACPHCRKPLTRCVICLMHIGTTTGVQDNGDTEANKLVDFSNWFTWCQTCRHGGHSSHIINWFREHSECPVTACTCRCFSVDTISANPTK